MKSFTQNNDILLVLEKGEELISSLNAYAKNQNLQGGWVTIIGGSGTLTMGFATQYKKNTSGKSTTNHLK